MRGWCVYVWCVCVCVNPSPVEEVSCDVFSSDLIVMRAAVIRFGLLGLPAGLAD